MRLDRRRQARPLRDHVLHHVISPPLRQDEVGRDVLTHQLWADRRVVGIIP